jgi:Fe-Mn family superoxide dismutase
MSHAAQVQTSQYELPQLPYAEDALQPHISKETIQYHYGKHHQKYVDNLNKLVAGTPDEGRSLEELILHAKGGVFNNAAQVWNHTFYWYGFSPDADGQPEQSLASALDKAFGSLEQFKKQFNETCTGLFGSGWVWLVSNANGDLEIVSTKDADNPMRASQRPLLTCDMWEHAYYVDYRNDKAAYLDAFWKLVDWQAVSRRYNEV